MVTYQEIAAASSIIETVDIKGKDYAAVNERIKVYRTLFPMGTINTEIVSLSDGVVVMKASVTDEDGKLLATGTAYEREGSTYINKTSYIENCETSAVGRALGMLGIGIDTAICSAEEVTNAINNQAPKKEAAPKKATTPKEEKHLPNPEKIPNCVYCGKPLCNEEWKGTLLSVGDIMDSCNKFYAGMMIHPHCAEEWKKKGGK